MSHTAPKRFGRDVDEFDLLRPSNNGIWNSLVLDNSRYLLDHVVDRLQVLNIDRGDDVNSRLE